MKYTAGCAAGVKTSQVPAECPNFSHIWQGVMVPTFRQDPSVTRDNTHISARQVPPVTRDRRIDRNCAVSHATGIAPHFIYVNAWSGKMFHV